MLSARARVATRTSHVSECPDRTVGADVGAIPTPLYPGGPRKSGRRRPKRRLARGCCGRDSETRSHRPTIMSSVVEAPLPARLWANPTRCEWPPVNPAALAAAPDAVRDRAAGAKLEDGRGVGGVGVADRERRAADAAPVVAGSVAASTGPPIFKARCRGARSPSRIFPPRPHSRDMPSEGVYGRLRAHSRAGSRGCDSGRMSGFRVRRSRRTEAHRAGVIDRSTGEAAEQRF